MSAGVHARGEDVTITDVTIKTPDRKEGPGDVNDVMPGSDGLVFLVILNKSSELRFGLRRSELIFRTWARSVSLWTAGSARALVESVPRESSVFRVFSDSSAYEHSLFINIMNDFIHPYVLYICIYDVTILLNTETFYRFSFLHWLLKAV